MIIKLSIKYIIIYLVNILLSKEEPCITLSYFSVLHQNTAKNSSLKYAWSGWDNAICELANTAKCMSPLRCTFLYKIHGILQFFMLYGIELKHQ